MIMRLWIARNEDLRLLIFPCKPNVNLNTDIINYNNELLVQRINNNFMKVL